MNNISGKSDKCCDEDSDVAFTDITTDSIINSGTITTNEIISKNYKYKDSDNNIYDNLNISYNTNKFNYYIWTPQTAGNWWGLQVLNTGATIKKVPNNNIITGSRFRLVMGLTIRDITQASGNIVSFGLKIGSVVTDLDFKTLPPKNLTPIIINLSADLVCTAKSTVAPFEYSFAVSVKYVENNDNQAERRTFINSSQLTNLTYVDATPSAIDYRYNIAGSTAFTTYERGVYTLHQTF